MVVWPAYFCPDNVFSLCLFLNKYLTFNTHIHAHIHALNTHAHIHTYFKSNMNNLNRRTDGPKIYKYT